MFKSKTINKIIGLSILLVSAVILAFALSGCNQEKKVVGNWHLKSLTVNAERETVFGNDLQLFVQKNVNLDKANVFTFKEDKPTKKVYLVSWFLEHILLMVTI